MAAVVLLLVAGTPWPPLGARAVGLRGTPAELGGGPRLPAAAGAKGTPDLVLRPPSKKLLSLFGRHADGTMVDDVGKMLRMRADREGSSSKLGTENKRLAKLKAWQDKVGADLMRPNPEYEGLRP